MRKLILSMILVLASTGAVSAQPVKNGNVPPPLTVVDANGKLVGRFDSGHVYIANLGGLTGLAAVKLGIDHYSGQLGFNRADELLFLQPDCKGEAYIRPTAIGARTVQNYYGTLYVQSAPATQIQYKSRFITDEYFGDSICDNTIINNGDAIVAPVIVIDTSGIWIRPFKLQ